MNDAEINPEVQELLGRLINSWANDGGPSNVIGDGLTRDDVLKLIVNYANAGELGEDPEAQLAHFELLLSQQPPFRLECDEQDEVRLVLTLGNRCVYTWSPVAPETVDAEVVALIGESLKNLASRLTGSEEAESVGEGLKRIGTTGGGSVKSRIESVSQMTGMLRRRLGTSNALTEWIGEGKSRDELLEMSLPGMPEHAQNVLTAKLNEQPPFSIVCDEDGKIHLELIVSGERVHTWTQQDLDLPKPKSWRMIVYPALGVLVPLIPAILILLLAVGMIDGYLFMRRTGRLVMWWRLYWAFCVLSIVAVLGGLTDIFILGGFFQLVFIATVPIAPFRFAYIWIYVKFFRSRDVLECRNQKCGALMTAQSYWDNGYRCGSCGTIATPYETGRRATWF